MVAKAAPPVVVPPVSPWGKPEGVRTRNKNKPSQKLIVRRRRTSKGAASHEG